MDEGGVGYIGEILTSTDSPLEEISIEGMEIGPKDMRLLCTPLFQVPNPKLKKLMLVGNYLSDFGLIYFGNILQRNSTLTRLTIRDNQVTEMGRKIILDGLRCNHTLVDLDLGPEDELDESPTYKEIINIIKKNETL